MCGPATHESRERRAAHACREGKQQPNGAALLVATDERSRAAAEGYCLVHHAAAPWRRRSVARAPELRQLVLGLRTVCAGGGECAVWPLRCVSV